MIVAVGLGLDEIAVVATVVEVIDGVVAGLADGALAGLVDDRITDVEVADIGASEVARPGIDWPDIEKTEDDCRTAGLVSAPDGDAQPPAVKRTAITRVPSRLILAPV